MYTHLWKVQLPTNLDALHCTVGPTWRCLHATKTVRWNQCLDAQKAVCVPHLNHQQMAYRGLMHSKDTSHRLLFSLGRFATISRIFCGAGCPYTTCIIQGSEKRSRITQNCRCKSANVWDFGKHLRRKRSWVQSCCFFVILVCSSAYEWEHRTFMY